MSERMQGICFGCQTGGLALEVKANVAVMGSADEQIEILEKAVLERVKLRPQFRFLKTVPGIGPILTLTIMLETGEIGRFAGVKKLGLLSVCGESELNNGKRKGSGNTKNGNKYLASRLWRRPTLPSDLVRGSRAFSSEQNPKAPLLSPSRR